MPTPEYIEIRRRKRLGIPFKAHYHGPGPGNPEYHVIPALIGTSPDPHGGPDEEKFLGYKYVGANGFGWRCFNVSDFRVADITDSPVPVPNPPIDPVDPDRQNCVVNIDNT